MLHYPLFFYHMIWYLIAGFVVGAILFSIIVKTIDKNNYIVEQKKVDDSVREELDSLKQQKDNLEAQKQKELQNLTLVVQKKELTEREIEGLQRVKDNTLVDIRSIKSQAEETANAFYEEKMKIAKESFGTNIERLADEYREAKEKYYQAYSEMMADFANQFEEARDDAVRQLDEIKQDKSKTQEDLAELRKRVSTAVEASKRAELEKTKKNFFRLILSDNDLSDVKRLKEVEPFLINKEVLAKLIWKTYYERPYGEMCNRVLGPGIKMGIYKITNLENNMPYIGQSVNIRERWREHIKAGLGINSSNNRLYTAMKQFGPENFTFELLEECDRSQLNQKERYWIDFFHTEDFGLNSNKGVLK